jgi:hypothetical protein
LYTFAKFVGKKAALEAKEIGMVIPHCDFGIPDARDSYYKKQPKLLQGQYASIFFGVSWGHRDFMKLTTLKSSIHW